MKAKQIFKITCALFAGLSLFACSNSYLDEHPNGYMQQSELKASDVKSLLDGMYLTQFQSGTGGTTDHDDFGQKSVDIETDVMSGDMSMPSNAYGWFTDADQLTGYARTAARTAKFWRYYFRLIKASNNIIDVLGGNENVPADDTNACYWAQAKAMRSFAYYNLCQIYAGNYSENKTVNVLPYYTTQKTDAALGLSTLETVATNVEKELTQAIKILTDKGFSRNTKVEIDADVASGMLAYVKLYIGKYDDAATLSAGVVANYPQLALSNVTTTGFADQSKMDDWIWAVDVTKENTGQLASFWGQVDYFTYSYAYAGNRKVINSLLYASIPTTDARYGWFHKGTGLPWGKFYSPAYKASGTAGGDRTWLNDLCFMRSAEMLLINAEANFRAGHIPDAKSALQALLDERDPTIAATVATMTNDQLDAAIYKNWRVEMWGEGKGLATMKRYKKVVNRGSRALSFANTDISYSDKRLVFTIPEVEAVNNPNLK